MAVFVRGAFKLVANIVVPCKVFYVPRGLPGSGKSHRVRRLIATHRDVGHDVYVFSNDDYMYESPGLYRWTPKKARDAVAWNLDRFEAAIANDADVLILDNTNLSPRVCRPFVLLAHDAGYSVVFLEPNTPWAWDIDELFKRNEHGVPRKSLEAMLLAYQPISLEDCLE